MATLLNLSKIAAKKIYLCTTEKFYLSRKISLMIHINTIASSTITLRITLYVDDDMWLIFGENLVVNFNAMFLSILTLLPSVLPFQQKVAAQN